MKENRIFPKFVEFIPDELDDGTIYISIRYATASHLCPCGCHSKVVTPLSPTDWALTYNGKAVSLTPSIGNWSFKCQSHYWINLNRIKWSGKMSSEQIVKVREMDRHRKQRYFDGVNKPESDQVLNGSARTPKVSLRDKIWNWLSK